MIKFAKRGNYYTILLRKGAFACQECMMPHLRIRFSINCCMCRVIK